MAYCKYLLHFNFLLSLEVLRVSMNIMEIHLEAQKKSVHIFFIRFKISSRRSYKSFNFNILM
jgi:hypothetical protein